jgi:nucleoside-diphosphate-sugar epimerase
MSGKRVLVTGASGFLGISLVHELVRRGYLARGFDLEPFTDGDLHGKAESIVGDIRDKDAVFRASAGADYVIHNAAVLPVSRSNRRIFCDVNVNGTRNILEASLDNRVEKLIFISSSAPYGIPREHPINERTGFNPVCDYGRSKIEAENVCGDFRKKGLNVVILRPRTIVGAGRMGIFQILFSWIADNKNIYIIGDGNNLFSLISDSDLVEAVILALEKDCGNEDFNLGTDVFSTVREDLRKLINSVNSASRIISIPAGPAKFILGILDAFGLVPFTRWHYMTPDKDFYFDISKAKNALGWRPKMSNVDALKAGYDYYLSNRKKLDSDYGITHRKSLRQRALKLLKKIS